MASSGSGKSSPGTGGDLMKKAFAASVLAMAAAFLLAALLLVAAGCNVSTANLSNVKIGDNLDGDQCS